MTWHIGQLVRLVRRLRADAGGVVVRLTPTLVVLRDGSRWHRDTGRLYGVGMTSDHIEDWGTARRRGKQAA